MNRPIYISDCCNLSDDEQIDEARRLQNYQTISDSCHGCGAPFVKYKTGQGRFVTPVVYYGDEKLCLVCIKEIIETDIQENKIKRESNSLGKAL